MKLKEPPAQPASSHPAAAPKKDFYRTMDPAQFRAFAEVLSEGAGTAAAPETPSARFCIPGRPAGPEAFSARHAVEPPPAAGSAVASPVAMPRAEQPSPAAMQAPGTGA